MTVSAASTAAANIAGSASALFPTSEDAGADSMFGDLLSALMQPQDADANETVGAALTSANNPANTLPNPPANPFGDIPANTPAPGGLPLTYAWQLPDAADAQTPSSAPQAETLPKPAAPQTWSVFATNESADLSTEQTAPNPSAALSGPIAELPTASSISEDGKDATAQMQAAAQPPMAPVADDSEAESTDGNAKPAIPERSSRDTALNDVQTAQTSHRKDDDATGAQIALGNPASPPLPTVVPAQPLPSFAGTNGDATSGANEATPDREASVPETTSSNLLPQTIPENRDESSTSSASADASATEQIGEETAGQTPKPASRTSAPASTPNDKTPARDTTDAADAAKRDQVLTAVMSGIVTPPAVQLINAMNVPAASTQPDSGASETDAPASAAIADAGASSQSDAKTPAAPEKPADISGAPRFELPKTPDQPAPSSDGAMQPASNAKPAADAQPAVHTAPLHNDTPAPQPAGALQPLAFNAPDANSAAQAAFAVNTPAGAASDSDPPVHLALRTVAGLPDAADGMDALALRILSKSSDGDSRFDIRLDPPELGHIEVSLKLDSDGNAQANVSADKPQTLDLLQRDAPALERALRDAGLALPAGLSFSLKGDGRSNAWRDGQSGARGRALQIAAVDSASANSAALAASLQAYGAANARLDIRV